MKKIELHIEEPPNVKYLKKCLSEGYRIKRIVQINDNKGSFEGFDFGAYFLEKPDKK